jgi:hypothetical protein
LRIQIPTVLDHDKPLIKRVSGYIYIYRRLTDARIVFSDVQHVAATTAALVASPRILTGAASALAEKVLLAFVDICKCNRKSISAKQ